MGDGGITSTIGWGLCWFSGDRLPPLASFLQLGPTAVDVADGDQSVLDAGKFGHRVAEPVFSRGQGQPGCLARRQLLTQVRVVGPSNPGCHPGDRERRELLDLLILFAELALGHGHLFGGSLDLGSELLTLNDQVCMLAGRGGQIGDLAFEGVVGVEHRLVTSQRVVGAGHRVERWGDRRRRSDTGG